MLFQLASRQKFRFQSVKGELTVEQLWDLPLLSRSGFDIDHVAKALSVELKTLTDDSFVTSASEKPGKALLEQKLELVKVIIAQKLADKAAADAASARAAERVKLLNLRAQKQDEALGALSIEEIDAKLASLG